MGDRHPKLWLDHNPLASLAAEFHSYPLGTKSHYNRDLTGFVGYRVPSYSYADPWVRPTGWEYLLDATLCAYTADGVTNGDGSTNKVPVFSSSPTTCRYGTGTIGPLTAGGVTGYLDASTTSVRAFARLFERLALAEAVARGCKARGETSGACFDMTAVFDATYGYKTAARYWGDKLVAFPTSSTLWSTDAQFTDLAKAENLIALAAAYDWIYPDLDLKKRRAWRERLYDEAGSLHAIESPNWPAISTTWPKDSEGRLRNGHKIETAAAVGIVANVLYYELDSSTANRASRTTWDDDVAAMFSDHMMVLGDDGAFHGGFLYFQQDTEYVLRFVESERLDPDIVSAGVDDTWYDPSLGWFRNAGRFGLHGTLLHDATTSSSGGYGWRTELGDYEVDTTTSVGTFARVAAYLDDEGTYPGDAALTQRMAWDGHNQTFISPGETFRDTLDILWWRSQSSLAPTTSLSSVPTHRCMEDSGIVSLRAGWATDDPIAVMRVGRVMPDHADPAIGTFELFADGPLTSGDGGNQNAKRTVLHSTMLVDGFGQHNDHYTTAEAGLEPSFGGPLTQNDGRFLTYLDNKGIADDGTPVDVVIVGTDMTGLYRADPGDDDRDGNTSSISATWVSDVDTTTRKLDELMRYFIWIGDANSSSGSGSLVVYDRYRSTLGSGQNPFRFDWQIVTSNRNTNGTRPTCTASVGSTIGLADYYRYTNGTSTWDVRYEEVTAGNTLDVLWNPMSGAPSIQSMNQSWYPQTVSGGSSCGTISYLTHVNSKLMLVQPDYGSPFSGALELRAIDPHTAAFSSERPVARGAGSEVIGHAVRRTQTEEDGYFVHVLSPSVDSGGYPQVTVNSGITGGRKFRIKATGATVAADYDVTILVADPVNALPYVTDGAGTLGRARVATVTHDDVTATNRFAAQMAHGGALQHLGTMLVEMKDASGYKYGDVGVTWGENAVYGSIRPPDTASTTVTIHVPTSAYTGTPTFSWSGSGSVSWNATTQLLTFTITSSGTFRVAFTGAASSAVIDSSCPL